jgi:hypothetical protein
LKGSLGYSSGAWPDEALERGSPRPMAKRKKNGGRKSNKTVEDY